MTVAPRYFYALALAGFFGLFGLLMLWNTVFAPSTRFPVALVLLLAVGPLLLPLAGLLNARPRSLVWTAYLSLPYFVHGCMEAFANPNERLFAGLEVVLSLMLFCGSSFYVRFNKQP